MDVQALSLLYLAPGFAVAVGLYVRPGPRKLWPLWLVLWPFFASTLFESRDPGLKLPLAEDLPSGRDSSLNAIVDEIAQAFAALPGEQSQLLDRQQGTIRAMVGEVIEAESRLVAMEQLLGREDYALSGVEAELAALAQRRVQARDPRVRSAQARKGNIEDLMQLAQRTRDELERARLALREIATRLHLLRFRQQESGNLGGELRDVSASIEELAEIMDGLRKS